MDTPHPETKSNGGGEDATDQSSALSRSSSFSSIAEAIIPNMQTTKEVW